MALPSGAVAVPMLSPYLIGLSFQPGGCCEITLVAVSVVVVASGGWEGAAVNPQ